MNKNNSCMLHRNKYYPYLLLVNNSHSAMEGNMTIYFNVIINNYIRVKFQTNLNKFKVAFKQ